MITTPINKARVWKGRQSIDGEQIDHLHTPRLRATIHRDSYDDQSSVLVESWTTANGWRAVTSRRISEMRTFGFSYAAFDRREREVRWAVENDLSDLLALGRSFFAGGES